MAVGDPDSSHRKLVPLEKAGSVVLICPSCDYEQATIPEIVIAAWRPAR